MMEKSKKSVSHVSCFLRTCKVKYNGLMEGLKVHSRVNQPIISFSKTCHEGGLVGIMETIEEDPPTNGITNETALEPLQFLSRFWNDSSVELYQALSRPNAVECMQPLAEANNEDSLAMKTHSEIMVQDQLSPLPCAKNGIELEKSISEFSSECKITDDMKMLTKHTSSMRTVIIVESMRKRIKNVKEKRKEERRLRTAEIHAATSVAEVAAAVAAFASANKKSKSEIAWASAAALVAAQCVEAAAMMGANHRHISSSINSAVCVKTAGDIHTLTAAAATALRGVETLKSRTRRGRFHGRMVACDPEEENADVYKILPPKENKISLIIIRDILLKGAQLLTLEKNRNPKWQTVSVYINQQWQVTLMLKSKRMGGFLNTWKESVVLELVESMWESRGSSDDVYHFGLNTSNGLVNFEFKDKFTHHIWIFGISQLLKLSHYIAAEY